MGNAPALVSTKRRRATLYADIPSSGNLMGEVVTRIELENAADRGNVRGGLRGEAAAARRRVLEHLRFERQLDVPARLIVGNVLLFSGLRVDGEALEALGVELVRGVFDA